METETATLEPSIGEQMRQRAEVMKQNIFKHESAACESNIRYYTRLVVKEVAKLDGLEAEVKEKAGQWMILTTTLKENGFDFEGGYGMFSIHVTCKKEDLPRLCKLFGRLDGKNVEKQIQNAEKNLVRLSYQSVKYPLLKIIVFRELTGRDKCKIVKVTREYEELICDVN